MDCVYDLAVRISTNVASRHLFDERNACHLCCKGDGLYDLILDADKDGDLTMDELIRHRLKEAPTDWHMSRSPRPVVDYAIPLFEMWTSVNVPRISIHPLCQGCGSPQRAGPKL